MGALARVRFCSLSVRRTKLTLGYRFIEVYNRNLKVSKISYTDIWISVVNSDNRALAICWAFLKWYASQAFAWRPCLVQSERFNYEDDNSNNEKDEYGEMMRVRTVKSVVTLQDRWAALVQKADQLVLLPLRRKSPQDTAHLSLQFSSQSKVRCSPCVSISQLSSMRIWWARISLCY